MVDLRRPGLPSNLKKLKPPIPSPGKAPTAPAAALQAVKKRAEDLLGKVPGKNPANNNPLLKQCLELLMSETAEGAALKRDLLSRAQAEFERRRKLAAPLCEILRPFQSPQAQKDFMRDVVLPAMKRQISSKVCMDRLNVLLKTKTPILDAVEYYFGPLTFTVGGGAEAGAGFGIEGAVGLAFHRRSAVGVNHAVTVAMGAYAETTACIQAAVAGGYPTAGESVTMDVSVSAASGIAGEFLISLKPVLHAPTLLPEKKAKPGLKQAKSVDDVLDATTRRVYGATVYSGILVDYEYAGFSLSMGVGAGLGGAIGFTGSSTFLLYGVL
jgi:hypothetical protein